jgi:SAM-dependent methyltransferase
LDASFDIIHGTETLRRLPPDRIQTDSENKIHSSYYGATKARPFLQLLRRLRLPQNAVFVDLGAGKGRVVMLAAKHGFRKIIGLEFSNPLCLQARANLEGFLRKCPSNSEVEIIESDVTQYHWSDEETIFFMFDPFSSQILSQVLKNIRISLERRPRTLWLIYNSPRDHATVEASGLFVGHQTHIIAGGEFRVYSNQRMLAPAP